MDYPEGVDAVDAIGEAVVRCFKEREFIKRREERFQETGESAAAKSTRHEMEKQMLTKQTTNTIIAENEEVRDKQQRLSTEFILRGSYRKAPGYVEEADTPPDYPPSKLYRGPPSFEAKTFGDDLEDVMQSAFLRLKNDSAEFGWNIEGEDVALEQEGLNLLKEEMKEYMEHVRVAASDAPKMTRKDNLPQENWVSAAPESKRGAEQGDDGGYVMISPRRGGLIAKMNDQAETFDGFDKLDLSMFGPEGMESTTDPVDESLENQSEPSSQEPSHPLVEASINRSQNGEALGLSLVEDVSGTGSYIMAIKQGSPASNENPACLAPGMLVVHVNGLDVRTYSREDCLQQLQRGGATINLGLRRSPEQYLKALQAAEGLLGGLDHLVGDADTNAGTRLLTLRMCCMQQLVGKVRRVQSF